MSRFGRLKKSRGVKSRDFTMTQDQIPETMDAIFFGNPAKPGWVEMYVNGKGRECVNALFPKARACFGWVESGDSP
jgi:hypothetical protein